MPLIQELDYGTPALDGDRPGHADDRRPARSRCPLALRSCAPRWRPASSVPKLCATDMLDSFGSLPPVPGGDRGPRRHAGLLHHAGRARHEGHHRSRASCAELRRGVMELYISDHPLDCLTCSANGNCELQDAGRRGRRCARCATARTAPTTCTRRVDASNPYFQFDPAKCIVCSRCVRACEEVQGTFALTIEGRGFASKIAAGHGRAIPDQSSASPAAPACRPARPRR